MQLEVISTLERLSALQSEWNRLLIPSPMQSPEWLTTWWTYYANESRELFVVAARDQGRLLGIAPWYREVQSHRKVLRWLGDGHVCSDHATLLTGPLDRQKFAQELANWLLGEASCRWDKMKLEAIDRDDLVCQQLLEILQEAECPCVELDQPGSCYVVLPATFDEYLMSVSKNHRKRCRRWEKTYFQSGRAQIRVATSSDDCLANWQTLVAFHNARRLSLGERGAFENPSFETFHRKAVPLLADLGKVQLRVLEVDGQPMAVEYVFQTDDTWYAYQSGMCEAGEAVSAGNLSILALIQDAIAAGCQRLDLLRGTEAYKFSWGALHRPAHSTIVRPPSSMARLLTLRDSAFLAAKRLRRTLVNAE